MLTGERKGDQRKRDLLPVRKVPGIGLLEVVASDPGEDLGRKNNHEAEARRAPSVRSQGAARRFGDTAKKQEDRRQTTEDRKNFGLRIDERQKAQGVRPKASFSEPQNLRATEPQRAALRPIRLFSGQGCRKQNFEFRIANCEFKKREIGDRRQNLGKKAVNIECNF